MIESIDGKGKLINYIPKKTFNKSFFETKKFGDFYFNRQNEDFRIGKGDISVFMKYNSNLYDKVDKITFEEDLEKTIEFLEKTEFLQLVSIFPTNKQVIDIDYTDVRKGLNSNYELNRTSKRCQCGKVETVDFEKVLSKEILKAFSDSGKHTLNNTQYDILEEYKGYGNNYWFNKYLDLDDTRENGIKNYILKISDLSTSVNKIKPNTIIIPTELCEVLFPDIQYFSNVLKKLNKNIGDMEVWSNPHNDDIIMFKKLYTQEIIENSYVFTPHILFAKNINEDTESEFYNPNKYTFIYNLIEVGFFTASNYLTLYK
jgi:hypothetical protein